MNFHLAFVVILIRKLNKSKRRRCDIKGYGLYGGKGLGGRAELCLAQDTTRFNRAGAIVVTLR